ncbi:MAG TPA: AsmA-like C-terminal region-containing protein, partial [Tichowtungia sp.]|nr:AsmA-like C-terminal region-containing protein [Tichowtungia sp.]
MTIQASLRSKFIDLAELLGADQNIQRDSDFHFKLPEHIDVNVNSSIDRLVFRSFEARDIFGNVKISEDGIVADPLKFKTCQGAFTADMTVMPKANSKFRIETHAEIRDIDIQQLFTEFGNFGQDFITNQHLHGKTNADVVFRTDIDNTLKIEEESIYSLVDIEILNGELIEHRSLIEVADYIRQNKLLGAVVKTDQLKQKLRRVEFSKLENQIEIKNSVVHIPEMQLESSAMNLEVSGQHGFDSRVDYRINFRLTEILTNNTHSEFGEIEDDGSGGSFFLRMQGPLDNLEIAYDKQAAKEQRREKFREEKETLKELLKEEFNIFGKKKDKEENTNS